MILTCTKCSQKFLLENFSIAKVTVICPNTLCGYSSSIDSLIELEYGLEMGIRTRTMLEALSTANGLAIKLTDKLNDACRKIDLQRLPPKVLVASIPVSPPIPWYKQPIVKQRQSL